MSGIGSFLFRHTIDNFKAGSVRHCLPRWRQLTNDKWVLEIVKGYRLELKYDPWQTYRPKPLRLDSNSQSQLDQALQEFLRVGIIEPCNFDEDGFYSTLFPIAKRDKSARIIFDLSELNLFMEYDHFKMDTVKQAIELVTPGCYFASIDFT